MVKTSQRTKKDSQRVMQLSKESFEDFYGYKPLVSPVSTEDNLVTDFARFLENSQDQSSRVPCDSICIDDMNAKRKDFTMETWVDTIRRLDDSYNGAAGPTCISKVISRRDLNGSVGARVC